MLTTAYSIYLKRIAVLDVLLLAGLYTLRVLAGIAATGVRFSTWLLAFSMFLFLSLAFLKRSRELTALRRMARRTAAPARLPARRLANGWAPWAAPAATWRSWCSRCTSTATR